MTGLVEFNSYTDAAVAITVRLVNTLTAGEARGRPYRPPTGPALPAAVVTALANGGPGDPALAAQDAGGIGAVAGALRRVFDALGAGHVDAAVAQVNRMLDETLARPRLQRHDGGPWHLHFHSAAGTPPANLAARCATSLAVVLGSAGHDRLGVCTAPRCDRVYVDISRNGTRRFCSTACQNRVKTAAYRSKLAG